MNQLYATLWRARYALVTHGLCFATWFGCGCAGNADAQTAGRGTMVDDPIGVAGSSSAPLGLCSNDAVERVAEPWDPGACEGPGFSEPQPRSIGTLSLRVVGPDDAPLAGVWAQACTSTACLPKVGTTDSAGRVSIGSATGAYIAGAWPTVEYGDGVASARWTVNPSKESGDLGPQRTFLLPPLSTAIPFPPLDGAKRSTTGGWVHASNFHLFVAKDSVVQISRLDYVTEAERGLRALAVPLDKAPAGVDSSLHFDLVFSATPYGSTFCSPARLVVCNTLSWDPGTAVEIFIQAPNPPLFDPTTGTWSQGWAPGPAAWGKVADGVVSADGSLIASTKGGIPLLTNIGIRKRAGT